MPITLSPIKHSDTPSSARFASRFTWRGITADEVHGEWWDRVSPLILRAALRGNGEMTALDILRAVFDRRMQLWAVLEGGKVAAVVVTEILRQPSKTVASVTVLAGDGLHEWIHLLEEVLEPWSREQGAQDIVCDCRPGLEGILKARGWHSKQVRMRKSL